MLNLVDQFTRRDSFGRRGSEAVSPHKGGSGFSGDNWRGGSSGDSWKGSSRNQTEAFHSLPSPTTPTANRSAHPWSSEREREREREMEKERERERERERGSQRVREQEREKERNLHLSTSHTQSQQSQTKAIDESEKMWHYLDPAGKTQGPFSLAQLRKWNSSAYFPRTLRVWRLAENQEDSILLTDALNGRFQKEDRKAASSYTTGQRRSGGDEDLRKSENTLGGNELNIDSIVNYGVTNSVSVSPAFAKAESGHAVDRSGSFSAGGTNPLKILYYIIVVHNLYWSVQS
jgi:GYF domain